ncbi:hypothetical protein HY989_06545 [Candidatus Micrarchaeota archaeon]|nr:hypothetical protein [Candidatus Micrarchaeota archaeon]
MEIISNANFLILLEKANAITSVSELFGEPNFHIANVENNLMKKNGMKLKYHLHISKLGKKEYLMMKKIKGKNGHLLSKIEIQNIAIAKANGFILLTDEPSVKKACTDFGVSCFTLPMLLKAFWAKKIISKKQVWEIMQAMEKHGKKFGNVDAILDQG